jgi:dienelactone hydrolase
MGWFVITAKVSLQFSRVSLALSLHMTHSGKIVGLRVLTLQAAGMGASWKIPPYAVEDVTCIPLTIGKGLYRVAAKLSLPASVKPSHKCPCIIFIGGSGPMDKDSTIGPLKPFMDMALGLANRGIASCRFDKFTCTIAGKLLTRNTTVTFTDEYVYHVRHAIRKVRQHPNVDHERIFLLGHSLGGLIAARLAAAEPAIAGCVLMACPAQPLYRCAIGQLRYFESLDDCAGQLSGDELSNTIEALEKQSELADGPTLTRSTPASHLPFGLGPAYWLEYREFDPIRSLQRSECPVLVLQGERDYQVTVNDDYAAFCAKFKDRQNVHFRLYEKLNHLFVPGEGKCTPAEYDIGGNVDVAVVDDIERWVKTVDST